MNNTHSKVEQARRDVLKHLILDGHDSLACTLLDMTYTDILEDIVDLKRMALTVDYDHDRMFELIGVYMGSRFFYVLNSDILQILIDA